MSTLTLDDGIQHANQAAGTAGSTTGVPTTPAVGAANGWTDRFGSTASIVTDASTTSHALHLSVGGGNNLLDGVVSRPTSEGGANQGILLFLDLNATLGLVAGALRFSAGTGTDWSGYWGVLGDGGGGQTNVTVFSFDGAGGFTSAGNSGNGAVFIASHYYALWLAGCGGFIEAAYWDLGTSKPAQTGAVPTLGAPTQRNLFANSAVAGSSTTPVGVSVGNAGGGNILRAVAYTGLAFSLSLSESSALINTTNSVTATGTFTNWTPGTPGAPTFTAVKTPTNDCTLSAQTVASYKSASFTLAHGATSGTITISETDPTTGVTSTATITVASSTTITLTSPANHQVFQRSGTTGTIVVSGTNHDTGPHSIEASWNGGGYVTIGTAVAANATFSGSLSAQPQGAGTLTVRFVDTPSTFIQATNVGVGDVFLIMGQSNGLGQGSSNQAYFSESRKASEFGKDYLWKELVDPTGDNTGQVDPVGTGQGGGSVWPIVATNFLANVKIPIGIINRCEGGTTISQWQPGPDHQDRGTLYGSAVHAAIACGGVKGVPWWQGESDAATLQATYQAALATIAATIHADLGCKLMPCKLQDGTSYPTVNGAIAAEWASDANVLTGPDLSDLQGDGLHLLLNGPIQEAAARWWMALAAAFYGTGGGTTITGAPAVVTASSFLVLPD